LTFFAKALLFFNDRSINGRMEPFSLNCLFELIDVLVFFRQEIEVRLKVGIND